jgi:hypothetical protein
MRLFPTLLVLAALYAQSDRPPAFEDYPAGDRYRGKPAAPQFTGTQMPDSDQRARERIEIEAEAGPNFAARYTLAHWACGTGCFSILVIETPTGKILRKMPFATLDVGYDRETDTHRYGGLSFRSTSSLLIAEGCFDGESRDAPDCSRRFYRWQAGSFELIKSIPVAAR